MTPSPQTSTRRATGTRATRVLGIVTLVMLGWLGLFGLVLSPADVDQGDAVRIMYVHVPTVWLAYLAFIVTAVCSALYLFGKRHSLGFDRVAGASAEIGVVFMALTLISGSLWGRITWGVYWQWDARLTTTALLFVTYIGYLAVRGLDGTRERRARRSAVIGLLAVVEIPLVHWSVRLWRSLHQEATILDTDLDPTLVANRSELEDAIAELAKSRSRPPPKGSSGCRSGGEFSLLETAISTSAASSLKCGTA